jgi:uncharacterized protein GlcG (DUF336 family)
MKLRTIAVATALVATGALAQSTNPQNIPQYGPNITLEQAKRVTAAAEAEAHKHGWPMAIAIVDNAGMLVHFQRADNTQTAGIAIAMDKARSAAMFRRPTKAFGDALAKGGENTRILQLRGSNSAEGGIPLYVEGKIVGAIGASGMAAEQDGAIATAGAAALK